MVGILVSLWGGLFSGAMLVSGSVAFVSLKFPGFQDSLDLDPFFLWKNPPKFWIIWACRPPFQSVHGKARASLQVVVLRMHWTFSTWQRSKCSAASVGSNPTRWMPVGTKGFWLGFPTKTCHILGGDCCWIGVEPNEKSNYEIEYSKSTG